MPNVADLSQYVRKSLESHQLATKIIISMATEAIEEGIQTSCLLPLNSPAGIEMFDLVGFTTSKERLQKLLNIKVGLMIFTENIRGFAGHIEKRDSLQVLICRPERALDLSLSKRLLSPDAIDRDLEIGVEPGYPEIMEQIADSYPRALRILRENAQMVENIQSRRLKKDFSLDPDGLSEEMIRLICPDLPRRALEKNLSISLRIEPRCMVIMQG